MKRGGAHEVVAGRSIHWEAVTALATVFLVLTGIFALSFAGKQIKEARDEARIQHLDNLVRQFDQSPLVDSRKRLALKRIDQKRGAVLPLDPEDPPSEMYAVLNFFDYVGLLEKRGYLNTDDVWDALGYWMFPFYADARPVIDLEKKDDPDFYANFSRLMDGLEAIELQRHGRQYHPSQTELFEFYSDEAVIQSGAVLQQRHRRRK
jgi:hypothetical protein